MEAFIEHGALGFRIEIEGRNDLLEFSGIRSDRFSLYDVTQPIPSLLLEIAVGVQGVKGLFEGCEVAAEGVIFVVKDFDGPIPGGSREVRDTEEDLLLWPFEGAGAHFEGKEALREQRTIF